MVHLYLEWKNWNLSNGREHIGDKEVFGRMLRAAVPNLKNYRPRINGGRVNCYKGIRLLTEGERAAIDDAEDQDEESLLDEDATFDPARFF